MFLFSSVRFYQAPNWAKSYEGYKDEQDVNLVFKYFTIWRGEKQEHRTKRYRRQGRVGQKWELHRSLALQECSLRSMGGKSMVLESIRSILMIPVWFCCLFIKLKPWRYKSFPILLWGYFHRRQGAPAFSGNPTCIRLGSEMLVKALRHRERSRMYVKSWISGSVGRKYLLDCAR